MLQSLFFHLSHTKETFPGHWITKIKLLVDGSEVIESEYKKGGLNSPNALFRIRLDKSARLEAVEHCNLHGK
jgi:desulfoferrodoxin (superoxide reductase-like protein)